MFITHFIIIIIKSEVSTFSHCCHICQWLCARGGYTIICCQFRICRGKAGFCFFYYCAVLWCAKMIENGYGPMVIFVYLPFTLPHFHHCAYVYEGVELMKILIRYILSSVSMIKPIVTIIFHAIHGAVGIQRTHSSYDDCENMRICVIYLIFIVKLEVWPICQCLGLGHATIFCAICLYILLYCHTI